MQIDNRQKILGILALAGVVLLLADNLVVTPLAANWKARSAKIAGLKDSLNKGGMALDREGTIRGRWEGIRTNSLPQNMSAAENMILTAFERWSRDSDLSISSMQPQWKQTEDEYKTLSWRADCTGSMRAVTKFLYDVEKDPLALKVDLVQITAKDDTGDQLSMALVVSGLVLTPQDSQ